MKINIQKIKDFFDFRLSIWYDIYHFNYERDGNIGYSWDWKRDYYHGGTCKNNLLDLINHKLYIPFRNLIFYAIRLPHLYAIKKEKNIFKLKLFNFVAISKFYLK